ncbi:MAG: NAD(P)-dependent oxidoreductase [Patescibacteria group bacterium]|nr:NAD(P)-dependent oxidoreductase [Patescibacteria group bacterium]
MNILITGANDSIGKRVIDKLKTEKNVKIKILINPSQKSEFLGTDLEMSVGDPLDAPSLKQATENIDTVIHLAEITYTNNPALYRQINTVSTKNLIYACQQNNVKKFIFVSSRVAGKNAGAYALSKFMAEEELKKSRLDWTILKLAEVYGTGKKEAISKIISLIKKNYRVPIIGKGNYLTAPVYIDDVVQVIISAALSSESTNHKTYIIAGPEEITYNELIDKISTILEIKVNKLRLPVSTVSFLAKIISTFRKDYIVKDQIPRLLKKKSADISEAVTDLNFKPIKFDEGIKKIIND